MNNKPKRPLRSTLEELTSSLVDAILLSARESLFNLAAEELSFSKSAPASIVRAARRASERAPVVRPVAETRPQTRAEARPLPRAQSSQTRARAPRGVKEKAGEKDVGGWPLAEAPPSTRSPQSQNHAQHAQHETSSELLITDPLALLAALETAGPGGYDGLTQNEVLRAVDARAIPELLRTEPSEASPTSASSNAQQSFPGLREGEVVVRRSAGGVVLRRRRA